jgi:hypothetical protein
MDGLYISTNQSHNCRPWEVAALHIAERRERIIERKKKKKKKMDTE